MASTLIVKPGAVFHGQVAASAAVNDVLELSGRQSGGTPITLGTQFTGFSTLEFASGASGTVDATKADLTAHTLSIDGFAIGDTLDIQFNSAFTGDHFALTAAGSGTYLTLASGADATLASLGHDVLNFVSDFHRGLTDGRIMSMHGLAPSLAPAANAADQDFASYGFTSHASIDHGTAHILIGVCKAQRSGATLEVSSRNGPPLRSFSHGICCGNKHWIG